MPKLRLLLAFRSDDRPALEALDLPPLHEDENWRDVGTFSPRTADPFLDGAGLGLQPEARQALLPSAAALDDLAGLVRPVTLNVVDHVVAQVVGAPEIRDLAPAVLGRPLTAQATRRPRSGVELVALTKRRRGEVRAVLTALARSGLARVLEPTQGLWELSHDFVARVVARHLVQGRRALGYAAPALLVAAIAGGAGAVGWESMTEDRAIRALAALGLNVSTMEEAPDRLRIEGISVLNS